MISKSNKIQKYLEAIKSSMSITFEKAASAEGALHDARQQIGMAIGDVFPNDRSERNCNLEALEKELRSVSSNLKSLHKNLDYISCEDEDVQKH